MGGISDTNLEFARRQAETLRILGNYQKFSKETSGRLNQASRNLLRGSLAWATRHSIWWQNTLGKNFLEKTKELSVEQTLQAIPPLTKTQARTNSTSMQVWVPKSHESQYQVHSTSGTTGQPMQVRKYVPYYLVRHYAARLLDSVWQKRDLKAPLIFLSTQKQAERHINFGEPFSYMGDTGPYEVKNIANQTPRQILEELVEANAPQVSLNGFVLGLLLSEKRQRPDLSIKVDEFMTFADQIPQTARDLAKELFGAKVTDRYSCEEFGFLAIQCPAFEHLHTLPFNNLIEIVDENGAPCPPGVPGRVLVTSLSNLATPMFRYELGDYAQWGEPCEAGIVFPVLEPLITRVRDSLVDEQGVAFRPTTGKSQFLGFQELTDFQFYLLSDAIVVLAAVHAELSEDKVEIFKRDASKMFRSKLPVHIIQVADLSWLGTWKRRGFIRSEEKYSPQMDIEFFKSISS